MSKSKSNRVFLSYAHEDLDKVNEVYEGMKKRSLNVWFDKVHMKPGTWKTQIEKAITRSRFFVICLSNAALTKTGDEKPGFQDKELNRAYNIAQDQSDQDFTIVPVRLEDCGRGDIRLSSFQQYDLFNDFETGLDMLAVHLGGHSLSDAKAKDERTEDEKIVDSLMGKAEVACYAADYDKALKVFNSVLVLEPGNTEALNNLGTVWQEKSEYDKAIEYYEKALESDIKTLSEDHPNVAVRWNNLGTAWNAKGEYDKAIEYFEKALESDIKTFGDDHPSVATYRNNLGTAWNAKGEYDKAISDLLKALESDIKTFGDDYPSVATRWNNLGLAWNAKGEYDKAIEYFEKALDSDIKTLGGDHPNVALRWNNLGGAWNDKGKYDKAIEYFEKALESDIKTFGDDHPSVAIRWNNLGDAWHAKDEYDKAIEYYKKALSVLRMKLGNDHPHTKLVETNLSSAKKEKLESK